MKSRDSDSFAISCVVMLMDGAGRREEHARAGREERGIIASLVKLFQEFFGVLFQVVDARFEGEKGRVIKSVVLALEVHEGLPRELYVEDIESCE